jgi:putative spermidine/putrescine transport system substrate-binding protein
MSRRPGFVLRLAALLLAVLALASTGLSVDAQQSRVVVASFGGAWERDTRTDLITPFEKEYNARVDYVVGLSTETLARLKAQKDNPQLDVVMLDDVLTAEAVSLGLLETLTPADVPNLKDLRKDGRFSGDHGVGFTFSATVLMYNTEKVKPAPTSWKVMWDPKYAGHVAIPGMNTTYGLHTLLMAGRLEGGSETNVKAGLEGLKRLQKDSGAVVYTSTTQLNTLAQQGQVWLAPYSSVWVNQLEKGGTPVAIAVPQEGIYPIYTAWSVVKGAKNRAAAMQFVNYALRKDVQEKFAPRVGAAPLVTTATLSPDYARRVNFDRVLPLDGDMVFKNRAGWVDEWNRAIQGR